MKEKKFRQEDRLEQFSKFNNQNDKQAALIPNDDIQTEIRAIPNET